MLTVESRSLFICLFSGEIREKKNLRRDKVISWEIIAQTEREQEIMGPSVQDLWDRQAGSVLLQALPVLPKLWSFKNRIKAFRKYFLTEGWSETSNQT